MKNQEISSLIGQGRAYNSSSFLLRVSRNEDNKPKNIAILASKKSFKTAVTRNKVKRLIKSAINKVVLEVAKEFSVSKKEIKTQVNQNNLVFSPKKGFENISFAGLVEEIKQTLIKNGIIRI